MNPLGESHAMQVGCGGRLRIGFLAAILCSVILLGCGEDRRLEKQVGAHHVSFVPPANWQYYDHGEQQAFEGDDARIVMKDLGLRRPPERGGATLEEWLVYDLGRMETATQRGLAARDSILHDEHSFYIMDTWDRLTHEYRRRHVVVPNGGSHLAIYMEKGGWEDSRDAIDELVESLRFVVSPDAADETAADSPADAANE